MPPPEGACGCGAPPGPLRMPLRTSSRPMSISRVELDARAPHARIGNGSAHHEPVPDEQDSAGADCRRDKSGALIGPVPADGLADESREECPGDAEDDGQHEPGG